jgi:methylmalonyl-CoA/ethylmalonyl-CoA epimerase
VNESTLGGFALHHIGVLVAEIEPAAQLYLARFGYQIASKIISDPIQTAYVQFLSLPGGANWLELVAPNGPTSKLMRALERGGGLHHLCYEVAQIELAGAQLREQAMLPLGAPAPATAFGGRRIAWFMDRAGTLVELVEQGPGPLSLV